MSNIYINNVTCPLSQKQEGLIYIEVDFANKPGSTDTNVQPMIRGQEDPTAYTFVDFSKKAPPEQDKPENVEQK